MVSSAGRSGRRCEPRDDDRFLSRMILETMPGDRSSAVTGGCPYRRPRAVRRSDRAMCESATADTIGSSPNGVMERRVGPGVSSGSRTLNRAPNFIRAQPNRRENVYLARYPARAVLKVTT